MKPAMQKWQKWMSRAELKVYLKRERMAIRDIDFIFENYSAAGHKYRNKKDDYCYGCVIDAVWAVRYFKKRFGKK